MLATLLGVVLLCQCAQGILVSPTTFSEDVGTAVITVEVNATSSIWVYNYVTENVTAFAGIDFMSAADDVVMSNTNTSTVSIGIIDLAGYQGDRDFLLVLTDGTFFEGPIEFTITILEDDSPPVPIVATSDSAMIEGSNITVTIRRNDSSTYPFNATLTTVNGTAVAGEDFEGMDSSIIYFGQDEMSVSVYIPTYDDEEREMTEMFNVVISGNVESDQTLMVDIKDNDTPVPFHCTRPGQNCANQSVQCDVHEGTCSPCNGDFEGADCSIDPTLITTDCDPSCVNGTCLSGTCLCDPGFAGEACDQKAYFAQCNVNHFSVCITPYGDFNGRIFVDGFADECTLDKNNTEEGIVDWCEGYGAVIPFNGTCGMLGPFRDEEDSARSFFKVNLWVRYTRFVYPLDEYVTFECSFMNESSEISSPQFNMVPSNGGTVTPNGETINFTPAEQTVTLESGAEIPNPLSQAVVIDVCVTVADVDGINGVVIQRIFFDNRRDPPDFDETLVYENGCDLGSLLLDDPVFVPADMRHTMCFSFLSFIYDATDPSPKLGIRTFSALYEDASLATQPTCDRRRKRGANLNENSVREGDSITTIYMEAGRSFSPNGGNSVVSSVQRSELTAECEKQWLMPAVIGLGVVAVTMVIIIAILSGYVIRQFRGKRLE